MSGMAGAREVVRNGAAAVAAPARRRAGALFGRAPAQRRRRRASDLVRLLVAMVLVGLVVLALHENPGVDRTVADAAADLPADVGTIAAACFWGFLGLAIGAAVVVAALGSSRAMLRDLAVGTAATAVLVLALLVAFGGDGGRPDASLPATTRFPLALITLGVVVALMAGPYLTRPARRTLTALVVLGSLAGVVGTEGLLVPVVGSVVLGWGGAAAARLLVRTPVGFPSIEQVALGAAALGVTVADVRPAEEQDWGVARFEATVDGGPRSVLVYGRDAADARLFAKAWRFALYRDGGPAVFLTRVQQVEHEALMTVLAGQAGARVPAVEAVGVAPGTEDAVLVLAPPPGRPLGEVAADDLPDAALVDAWALLGHLRRAQIALGALAPDQVVVEGDGVGITGLHDAEGSAAPDRLDRDAAELLVVLALATGPERAVTAARDALGPDGLADVLPLLQPAALSRDTRRALPDRKAWLTSLREQAAAAAGVDPPELAEVRRVDLTTVLMVAGTFLGFWLLVGQLTGLDGLWSTLADAAWAWVLVGAVVIQLTKLTEAVALTGGASAPLPFAPVVGLQFALDFTGLVGGTVANTATRIRFFQQRGLAPSVAVSSGILVSATSMFVQAVLFLSCFLFAGSSLSFARTDDGSNGGTVRLVLLAIVLAGVLVGVLVLVPRLRRFVADKVRPQLATARANVTQVLSNPRRVVRLLGGNAGSQLLFAGGLALMCEAYGQSVPLPTLVLINTVASLAGGVAPVPGGMGVVEAGLIGGLTAYGVPQTEAVAIVFTYRLFSTYLPPAWGWGALVSLRHRGYL